MDKCSKNTQKVIEDIRKGLPEGKLLNVESEMEYDDDDDPVQWKYTLVMKDSTIDLTLNLGIFDEGELEMVLMGYAAAVAHLDSSENLLRQATKHV